MNDPDAPIELLNNNEPLYCGIVFADRFIGPTGPGRASVLNANQQAAVKFADAHSDRILKFLGRLRATRARTAYLK